jgi:type II secretory pathway component PulM
MENNTLYCIVAFTVLVGLYRWWWHRREGLTGTPNSERINKQTAEIQALYDQLSKVTVSQASLDDLQTKVDQNVDNTTDLQNLLQQKKAQEEAYPAD